MIERNVSFESSRRVRVKKTVKQQRTGTTLRCGRPLSQRPRSLIPTIRIQHISANRSTLSSSSLFHSPVALWESCWQHPPQRHPSPRDGTSLSSTPAWNSGPCSSLPFSSSSSYVSVSIFIFPPINLFICPFPFLFRYHAPSLVLSPT